MDTPSIEEANGMRERAARAVHDLVQLAYDAGRQRGDVPGDLMKPSAKTVTDTLSLVERSAVRLAHARMEETARMCGFEGLTEALGYLITLRDNPVAKLLREGVELAETETGTEPDLASLERRVDDWVKRAKAVVGDKAPPPEAITVQTATGEQLDAAIIKTGGRTRIENEVLSGCAVRAAIQREEAWDFYSLPRTHVLKTPLRGDVMLHYPIYFWAGRPGRPSSHNWFGQLPEGGELVIVDDGRGDPNGPAPACRLVSGLDPFFLGHTLCISRDELKPVDASYKPLGGATAG